MDYYMTNGFIWPYQPELYIWENVSHSLLGKTCNYMDKGQPTWELRYTQLLLNLGGSSGCTQFCSTSILLKSVFLCTLKTWLEQDRSITSGNSSSTCKWGCNLKCTSPRVNMKEFYILAGEAHRNFSVCLLTAAIPLAGCQMHLWASFQVVIHFSTSDTSYVSHTTNRKMM